MPDVSSHPHRWRILAITLCVTFMGLLDVTIVNVALPRLRDDLAVPRRDTPGKVDGSARFGIDADTLASWRRLGLFYDRNDSGEYLHFYTRTVGRTFFEIVERRDGYTGYGHTSAQVGKVVASAELLARYVETVHDQTVTWVAGLDEDNLDRVVDTSWDPPVTLGARLVSVVNDDTQHVGQAAYLRGLLTA